LNGGGSQVGYGFRQVGTGGPVAVITISATEIEISQRGASQTGPMYATFQVPIGATGGTANFQFAQLSSSATTSFLLAASRAFIRKL
jgi:hypothetical protein